MAISNMTNHGFAIIICIVIASASVHAGPVCDTAGTGTPYICADWSGPEPIEGTDFTFDFLTDPANPGVTLISGALDWVVYSQVSDTDATPANIGTITINPTIPADSFGLTIANGSVSGAANVGSIVLTAAGHSGYSNLKNSTIDGDLNGTLKVVQDAVGIGGELQLTVNGDANANITAPVAFGLLIGGDANGAVTITNFDPTGQAPSILDIRGNLTGTIDVNDYRVGDIFVDGDISGTLDIETWSTAIPAQKTLRHKGAVTSTGLIRIGSIIDFVELAINDIPGVNGFAGTLKLDSGLAVDQAAIIHGAFTGTVHLGDANLAGWIALIKGGSGTIKNVGAVGGFINLTQSSALPFSGTATVASVSSTGTIRTVSAGDMNGTINVIGDLDGPISVSGHVRGDILVGGGLQANVDIGGSLAGDLKIGGDANANVVINESILRDGRILIDGILSGDITIEKRTVGGTLIRATDGLGTSASVTINNSRGPHDAGGSMYFGDASSMFPVPTTFDGNVLVKDCDQGVHAECSPTNTHGLLLGGLTVRGCHATNDGLDICISGTGFQLDPLILQGGCANQVVALCSTGCP